MKETTISALGRGIAFTAFATFGMVGVAHADWANSYGETGISGSGYFSSFGSAGQGAMIDESQYDKVNLGPLSASLMAPKRGAQGPMRDDDAKKLEMQMRDIEARLGPIGGRDTP